MIIQVQVSPKLLEKLKELREMEGFGETYEEIIRNFTWLEINRLIAVRRLTGTEP